MLWLFLCTLWPVLWMWFCFHNTLVPVTAACCGNKITKYIETITTRWCRWLLRVVIVFVYFVTGTVDVILFPQHVGAGDCCVLWVFLCTLWPLSAMYCGCDFVSTTRCYWWLLRVVIVSVHVVTTKCDILWMWFCFHNTLPVTAACCECFCAHCNH